ncbi:MAG: hypothetical protein HKN91_18060 [Acidimicrobiia bacterium]|nr:hypothetical protein [Acidimicrobiia bacterium]
MQQSADARARSDGIRDRAQPLLPVADRKLFRVAIFAAARQVDAIVGEEPERSPFHNYVATEVTPQRGRSLLVLKNDYLPIVAFSLKSSDLPEFVAWPQSGAALIEVDPSLRVCEPDELNRRPTDRDLAQLGDAERQEVKYWKPTTIGEIIFNWWD